MSDPISEKRRYEYRKANGICTRCGKNKALEGKTICSECAEKMSVSRKANREYARKIGKCTVCHQEYTIPGKCVCERCNEKMDGNRKKNYDADKVHKRDVARIEDCRSKGICIGCKKRPVQKGFAYCSTCRIKRKTRIEANKCDIERSERYKYGLCYVCGEPIDTAGRSCQKCKDRTTPFLLIAAANRKKEKWNYYI